MHARKWITGSFTALALAALVVSCGGTGGGGGKKGSTDQQFILNSNNSGRLILNVSPDSVDANKTDRIGLVAVLSDSHGNGISGVTIEFSSDLDDITFLPSSGTAVTNANGRADVIAVAGTTPTGTGDIIGRGAIFAETPPGFGLRSQVPITLYDVGFIDSEILGVIPTSLDLVEPAPGQVLFFNIVGGTPPYLLKNEVSGIGAAVISQHCLPGCTENGGVLCIGSPCQRDADCNLNASPTPAGVCAGPIRRCLASCRGTNCAGSRCDTDADCNDGSSTPSDVCKDSGQSIAYIISNDPPTGTHGFVVEDSVASAVDVTVTVSFVCGNGVARGEEQCDLGDVREQTCESLGRPSGQLGCNDDCTFNFDNCSCGNGTRDGQEQCDLIDFGSATCASFGLPDGVLTCTEDCTIDTASCSGGGATPTPGAGVATPTFTPGGGVATPSVTATPAPTLTGGATPTPGAGVPSNLALALLTNGAGDNGNGTLTTVIAATVTDTLGNPVPDTTNVFFSISGATQGAIVSSPSGTNVDPPCDVANFEADTSVNVVNQPGVSHTCITYPTGSAGAQITLNSNAGAANDSQTFNLPPPPP